MVIHDEVRWAALRTGVRVPYVAQGQGGTGVVLLHAWGESLGAFDRLRPLLPSALRVFAFDQRGQGDADKPVAGYGLPQLAEDAVAFMDAVGLESAVLIGSSSGGYIAQQVALDRPDRVAGMVLVGSPRSLRGRPPFAAAVEELTDPIDPEWVRSSLAWFPLANEVPAWFLDDRVQDGVRMPARAWIGILTGLMTAVPPTEVGTIHTPTLILWGGRDELLPRSEQDLLAAAITDSRLLVHPDAAHLLLWERPDWVAQAITEFVRGMA